MPSPPLALQTDASRHPDTYLIRLEGELEPRGCAALESALADAERSEAHEIVVDIDGLSAIDEQGLRTLLTASRRSASNGDRLRVTRGRGEVAYMLWLTMLDVTLPFVGPAGATRPVPVGGRIGLG